MFTYVKLRNFLSFGEVTFNFKKTSNTVKNFIAVYGENGSGKSNFVKSFDFLCHSLVSFAQNEKLEIIKKMFTDNEQDIPDNFQKIFSDMDFIKYISSCRTVNCDEPSEIEYGFLLNNHEGKYKVIFTNECLNESLYYFTGKQRGYLFDISVLNDGKIRQKYWSGLFSNAKIKGEITEEVKKYWGKHTFLAILIKQTNELNYSYIRENFASQLLDVINMFGDMTVISKQSNEVITGIVSRKSVNVLENLRNGKISKNLLPQLECSERILRDFFTQTYADIKDVSYEKSYSDDNIIYQLYVDKMISGSIRHINFENESAGTKQVLEVVKMLLGLFRGTTVIYDEIDNGIHDVLLDNILNSLVNEITGQLIITTHNTLLLESINHKFAYVIDVDYLGNKQVRCLDEYGIQNSNNVRNMYLKGLLGGTPYIDGINYDNILSEIKNFEEEN